MSIKEHPPQLHVPVLLEATLETLHPIQGETYLDLTAGYGGHASALIERTANPSGTVLVDRDEFAISKLGRFARAGANIRRTDFLSAARQLVSEGRRFDIILADLGVSSPQLDQGERGFSFSHNGPLDMRMDQTSGKTAADLVNTASLDELTTIIHTYGEEPYMNAKHIAEQIVATRPFYETEPLAELIKQTSRGRHGKIHPATRTFQALRIAVNDELGQIEATLPLLPKLLNKEGRVGIISFHSLEDRLVKRFFKEQEENGLEGELHTLTKKPISGATDDVHNPRARSAKLRVAVKK